MSSIRDAHNEWRDRLTIASYRGVFFHVEVGGRMSGRRVVVHEYPKRNTPYSEDMGRHAVRWQFTAYIILNDKRLQAIARRGATAAIPYVTPFVDLIDQRNALINALEEDGPGLLIHPSLTDGSRGAAEGASSGSPMMCMCERYSVSETRERGGYYEFELQFVEAGVAPKPITVDTAGNVTSAAGALEDAATAALATAIRNLLRPPL